jgi:hypothetical protein
VTTLTQGALPSVRWGAVAAGTVVSIAVQIVLGLFGAGVRTQMAEAAGFTAGTALWLLAVPALAFFAGGYIGTRIAGAMHAVAAHLHALIIWATGLLVSAFYGGVGYSAIASVTAGFGALLGLGAAVLGGLIARRSLLALHERFQGRSSHAEPPRANN